MQDRCVSLDHWLRGGAAAPDGSDPPADLIAHGAACARCKDKLLALVSVRGVPGTPPAGHVCASIVAQLPAYVGYERVIGAEAAAQAFPAVWWSTLVCARCADAYTALYAAAPAAGKPRPRRELRVRGAVLRRFLSAEAHLGVAWGQPYSDVIIAEEEHDECRIQLYLRRKYAGLLTLVVRTEPPTKGIATLMVAHESYYLQLDSEGSAVFTDLLETLFDADTDLAVTLDTLF